MQHIIQQFLDYLEKEKRYSPNTLMAYQIDIKQFRYFLNGYFQEVTPDFQKVDKTCMKHFLGYLIEKGLAARTVARKLATMKAFFKYQERSELINVNPVSSIRAPKLSKRLPIFLEEHIIASLMEAPSTETVGGLCDRTILELFYGTGMRLSELVNLNVEDLDLTENLVKVVGKGNKERIVPFGDVVRQVLIKYLKKRNVAIDTESKNIPLFVSNRGRRMSPRTVQVRLKRYFQQISAGIGLSPHILRHTFATHLLDRGADIRAVKDLLGHESLSSTQVYTHLKVEQMKKVFRQAHPHAE
ncbi:MAG: tyrosine recombinase XerC [Candidatus Marinimicrobia bacterium]|nr:tyrosine recombinase XerC [Candidatus Neomarinimicrobiota bacterium]